MEREDDGVAFSRTIKPLALAPLAAVIVLTGFMLRKSGADALMVAPFLALRVAPFCYGAAVLFVVPIVAIRPQMRKPTYLVATVWGVLSAGAALTLFAWFIEKAITLDQAISWDAFFFAVAGAASGLLYAYLARRP